MCYCISCWALADFWFRGMILPSLTLRRHRWQCAATSSPRNRRLNKNQERAIFLIDVELEAKCLIYQWHFFRVDWGERVLLGDTFPECITATEIPVQYRSSPGKRKFGVSSIPQLKSASRWRALPCCTVRDLCTHGSPCATAELLCGVVHGLTLYATVLSNALSSAARVEQGGPIDTWVP